MSDITLNNNRDNLDDINDKALTQDMDDYVKKVKEKCFENFYGREMCGYIDLEGGFFLTWTKKVGLEMSVRTTETERVEGSLKVKIRSTASKILQGKIRKNRAWMRAEELAIANMRTMLDLRYHYGRIKQTRLKGL